MIGLNKSMTKKVTANEILEAINTFADKTEERFDNLESDVEHIKTEMVTKDYLDDKIADLKGHLVSAINREDNKVNTLTNRLHAEKSLSAQGQKEILALKPWVRKV
jgi:hypothetical protein